MTIKNKITNEVYSSDNLHYCKTDNCYWEQAPMIPWKGQRLLISAEDWEKIED